MSQKRTRTVCTGCHARCGAIVTSKDNLIVKVEGDPDNPHSHGAFCGTGLSEREIHNNIEERILYPMKRVGPRGSGEWERISWDEALDTMVSKGNEVMENYGPQALLTAQGTGRTWNHWHRRLNNTLGEEGWGLTVLHVCLMPHILPNAVTLGAFNTGVGDLANSSTMVVWGANPSTPAMMPVATVLDRHDEGAKLIVIDPRFTDWSKDADLYLRPRPGTDGALALGFMHLIIQNGHYDADWIDRWTYGFEELKERVSDFTPEKVSKITGIPEEQIIEAAEMMGTGGPVGFNIVLGPGCMHTNSVQNGRAIACLQGLLGYIDAEGGLTINQAFDVMLNDDVTLVDATKDPGRPELFNFGGDEHPLLKTFATCFTPSTTFKAIITGEPKPIKMMVCIACDPLLNNENSQLTYEALTSPNLELIVVKDFYFSPTAKLADIVLPSADWSERDTTDEEFFVNMYISTERAVDPPGECWDDWKFLLEWGKRINPEQWPWADEKEMALWRVKTLFNKEYGTWDDYVADAYWPIVEGKQAAFKKYESGGLRPDQQPGFATATGRIEFKCDMMAAFGYDPVPDYTEPYESPISTPELAKEYPLILITGHRLYSFFHSAWTNIPAQRALYPYPFAVINPKDAANSGISDGEWVTVESPRGQVRAKAEVSHEIGEGVIALPRPGWRDECKELGLPGYSWDGANPNILVPSEPAEPHYGSTAMRSSLCRVVKGQVNS